MSKHVPVMVDEVLEQLDPRPGQTFVDGTLGGGGHAQRLAAAVAPNGLVIGLDRDPAALDAATRTLAGQPVRVIDSDYRDLPAVLEALGMEAVDGVLLDLGMSSDQLADEQRGFSFDSQGPLDLRFDPRRGQPAWRWLERLSRDHLAGLLARYGDERYSRRIADQIVKRRRTEPIRTAAELARLVRRCIPPRRRRWAAIDPATRTFQALRIAVNDELRALEAALQQVPALLRPGARLAIISYHSLEDRLVKDYFRDQPCYEALCRRPIRPCVEETARNRRARSAKLRVARRRD